MTTTNPETLYILNDTREVIEATTAEHMAFMLRGIAARRVAFDQVAGADVSTVFLRQNLQFGDGPPLVFETMVFGGESDGHTARYSTWAEAEAGHAGIVAKLLKGEAL